MNTKLVIKMEENIKIIHTTEGIKTICKKCGQEIMSMLHKCPLARIGTEDFI